MNINEMVVDSFKDVEIGKILSTQEIKKIVSVSYKINDGSFQPSDMCYNRTNKGLEKSPSYNTNSSRIFLWIKRGQYKYVGPNYIMNPNEHIYSDPRN